MSPDDDLYDARSRSSASGSTITSRKCEEAIESIRTRYPEQVFKFQAEGDLNVEADAARLQQVLSNLLHNAVQYGDRNAPVSVRAVGEKEVVVMMVCNAGEPIPQDALPSLFDPLIEAPRWAARPRRTFENQHWTWAFHR